MKKGYKQAASNIKARMNANYAMHYCEAIDSSAFRGATKSEKNKILQKKAYLTTFAQSNLYEQFLILQAFVGKDSYLSEMVDKALSGKLDKLKGFLSCGWIKPDDATDKKIQGVVKSVIKDEMQPFLQKVSTTDASFICYMLREDADTRKGEDGFQSVGRYLTYAKLMALVTVIKEKIDEEFNTGKINFE